jgi:hypothetical protein
MMMVVMTACTFDVGNVLGRYHLKVRTGLLGRRKVARLKRLTEGTEGLPEGTVGF